MEKKPRKSLTKAGGSSPVLVFNTQIAETFCKDECERHPALHLAHE